MSAGASCWALIECEAFRTASAADCAGVIRNPLYPSEGRYAGVCVFSISAVTPAETSETRMSCHSTKSWNVCVAVWGLSCRDWIRDRVWLDGLTFGSRVT